MVLPEAFGLDRFAADGTMELPRVGVVGVGVLDAPGGSLGAEEGASVGHGLRFGLSYVEEGGGR